MKKIGFVLFVIGLVMLACGAATMFNPGLLPVDGGLLTGCGCGIFGYGAVILMGLYLNEPAPEA